VAFNTVRAVSATAKGQKIPFCQGVLIVGCLVGGASMRRICLLVIVWMFSNLFAYAQGNVRSITINPSGAASLATSGSSPNIATGYARLTGNGTTLPAGQVVFGFSTNGALISETAVPGTTPILAGRIYAEVGGSVNTGLAIANPNNQPATISFFFTDFSGMDFGQGSMTLAANSQIAQFLNQPPFNASVGLRGTFTFQSSVPIAAIVLRGFTNERSEFLMTTLPVADLNGALQNQPILFPQYADGGGWTTQIILVNPTEFTMNGTMKFSGQISSASTSDASGTSVQGVFNYSIPPHTSRRFQSGGAGDAPNSGSIQVTPTNNSGVPPDVSITPSGVAIFSYKKSNITITEAGVPPVNASTAFRIYAEASGDFNGAKSGSVQSGVAIANPSQFFPVTVSFELFRLDGVSTGLGGSLDLVANGQKAIFLTQIPGLANLQLPFKGLLRVSVPQAPGISLIGLRGRFNERGDLLIATTPPVADNSSTPTQSIFPHLADGGGYSTQFILINTDSQTSRSVVLSLFAPSGNPLPLTLR
jgi:hypothetical protein